MVGLNVTLEPGAVTEEVQVRADQIPDVDLETSQVSNLVDERAIKDLPLITRNPYELVLLSPGTAQTNSGLGGVSVNGSRERNNNFLLDGVDNNDTSVPGGLGGVLSANSGFHPGISRHHQQLRLPSMAATPAPSSTW